MNKKMIMPNHIVVKDGLACGDRITLLYDFDNEFMNFELISNGCQCCDKMCNYLCDTLNGKSGSYIVSKCEEIERLVLNGMDVEGFEQIGPTRKECYISPLPILKKSASECDVNHELSSQPVDLYVDKLDCDACATRENVSWLYQKPRHEHGKYTVSDDMRKFLMKLGKVSLDDYDTEQIKHMYSQLKDDEFEFLEEYKLMPMVYQNLKQLGCLDYTDDRWRLLVYQYQRTIMAKTEIEKINQFIADSKVDAHWVKGAYTRELYSNPMMRNLTDFDLLVLNEDDAFKVISWLLEHEFKIFPDSFSLKKTTQDSRSTYTGHLHFQKIICLQYRLIVDINFTGFPMIRVASYKPRVNNGKIALESIIVVALCHLFKHKEMFIKDINDLYIMLIQNNYSIDVLNEELNKNGLQDLFSVVLKFIRQEYDIPVEAIQIKELLDIYEQKMSAIELKDWPYSVSDVQRIKTTFFAKFAENIIGSQRIYLYPATIFSKKLEITHMHDIVASIAEQSNMYKVTQLSGALYQIVTDDIYFIVTPIGIFLEMKEHYVESMKKQIRKQLSVLMEYFCVDIIDISYAIAFEENWLDN